MRIIAVLVFLFLPIFAFGQSDCSEVDALIYDDGDFENALGTSSVLNFVHLAQLMEPADPADRLTSFCFCFSKLAGGNSSLAFDVAIWAPDGAGGAPGTRIATLDNLDGGTIATFPNVSWRRVNLVEPFAAGGDFYIGPTWSNEDIFLCSDESSATPRQPAYLDINILAGIRTPFALLGVDLATNFRAAGIRSVMTDAAAAGLDQAALILPGFDFDTENAAGRTTFFSIANHLTTGQSVSVKYYGDNVTQAPAAAANLNLAAKETRPTDIRAAGIGGLAGPDGIARGLVLIGDGANEQISGDFQRVNFASDFATGDRMVRPSEFCNTIRHRFLDFGSGTSFQILLNRPPTSGAALAFTAYDEAGNELATGTRSLSSNLLTTTAAALVPGSAFGSIEFDLTASGGGAVFAEYSAFGRFSLENGGECLDAGGSGLRFEPVTDEPLKRTGDRDLSEFKSIQP